MSTRARSLPAERQRTRRRRLLRTLLLKFLKRLKKACETLETPAQWYEVTKELRGILNQYRDVLSSSDRDELYLATILTDETHTGITQACTVLQSKLVGFIALLPAGGLAAPLLIGAALIVAAVVAIGAIVLNQTATMLTIQNVNCPQMTVTGRIPVSLPGLELPATINTNSIEQAKLPAVPMHTEFQPPDMLNVSMLGAPIPFRLPRQISSAVFDGQELLRGSHTFDLGKQKEHSLVVRCN